MIELIFLIIFFIGLIGMSLIVFRKMPVLAKLVPEELEGRGALKTLKEKIKNNRKLKVLSREALLEKTCLKVRDLTVKAEKRLKEKSLERKQKFKEDYWKKLRRGD